MDTNEKVLNAAIELGTQYGIANITRRMVARRARVSEGLVSHYMGGREEMRAVIKRQMRKAGKVEPDAATIAKHGVKLRKRKPRKSQPREYSAREVRAIRRREGAK